MKIEHPYADCGNTPVHGVVEEDNVQLAKFLMELANDDPVEHFLRQKCLRTLPASRCRKKNKRVNLVELFLKLARDENISTTFNTTTAATHQFIKQYKKPTYSQLAEFLMNSVNDSTCKYCKSSCMDIYRISLHPF